MTASLTIAAAPQAVFAVLPTPPRTPPSTAPVGVRGSLDGVLTTSGQIFRMAMFHRNHPDKDYRMANLVEVFDPPRVIGWKPGNESPDTGDLSFGEWTWRYDLAETGPAQTTVTLTYDWSRVPDQVRQGLSFPPFGQDHLDNSLRHLAELVGSAA